MLSLRQTNPIESLPSGFLNDQGQETPFTAISQTFQNTPYYERLEKTARFIRFIPEGWSNQRWEALFGADYNNARHMQLTYGLARRFVGALQTCPERPRRLTREEVEVVLISAAIHDWAEAVVGDVTYNIKNDTHEKQERAVLAQMLEELERERISGDLKIKILETVFNTQSELGHIFSAVEKVGYLRSAILAWKRYGRPGLQHDYPEVPKVQALTAEVFGNIVGKFTTLSKQYSPVKQYLLAHSADFSEIFAQMPDQAFDFYQDAGHRHRRKEMFQTAGEHWQAWKTDHL